MIETSSGSRRPAPSYNRRGPSFFPGVPLLRRWHAVLSLSFVAVFVVLAFGTAAAAGKDDGGLPNTAAPVFVLMDGESGSILAEKDGTRPFNPGDMVKLMTAEVVFDALQRQIVSLDTEYAISEHAWQRGRGGSMFALLKSRVRVEDLLRGITILSADDGAIALAEGLSGNEDSFVKIMNERAKLIDLKDTFFSNSTGSGDAAQRTTARDIARLGRILLTEYPEYYRLYAEKSFTWSKIEQQNRNPLFLLEADADGIKAARGTSDGFALIGSAKRNGKRLIVVVAKLGTSGEVATEAQKILRWGFDNFAPRALFSSREPITSAKVYGGETSSVPLVTHGPVNILWREGASERISMRVEYKGPLLAPVREGMQVGELTILKNGVRALEVPVYTGADVAKGSRYRQAVSAAEELSGRALRNLWQWALGLAKKKS